MKPWSSEAVEAWSSGGLAGPSDSDEGGEGCGCLSLKI